MANFRIPRKPTPVRKKNGGTTQFYRPLRGNEFLQDGDYKMTEVTMTFEEPSGKFVVVPSIYMDKNNKPVQFTKESQVFNAAMNYEQYSGKRFPRFNTEEEADKFAKNRSDSGGTGNGPLAR